MGAKLSSLTALTKATVDSIVISNGSTAAPPNTTQAPALDNQLSAWALLWAFVPIALNTMMQPSGRILGLRSWYNFALRISPLICAVSAISTFIQLVLFVFTSGSVEEAFLEVAAQQFKPDAEGEEDGDREAHFLRRNTIFRVGIFALGALPQIIKIYASKGIPWAQACCTSFLAAFVLDEALLFLGSRPRFSTLLRARLVDRKGDDDHLWLSGETFQKLPALVRWIGIPKLLVYVLTLAFDIILLTKLHGHDLTTALALFPMICCMSLLPYIDDKGDAESVMEFFLFANALGLGFIVGPWSTAGIQSRLLCSLLAMAVDVGFTLAVYLMNRIVDTHLPKAWVKTRLALATFVILNHVVYSLLYLGFAYDPTDTFRPHWTIWLG